MRRAAAALAVAAALLALAAAPALADPYPYGPVGSVNALAVDDDDNTYAVGAFTSIGRQAGRAIALDLAGDGTPLEDRPIVDGSVSAAIPDGSGGFYIGGSFQRVGLLPQQHVAHLRADGTADPAFSVTIVGSTVYALALDGGTLYVGGSFSDVGGEARGNLAAVDATTGAVRTAWNPGAANGNVNALAVIGSRLYVGGAFTAIGADTRTRLAIVGTSSGTLDAWAPDINSSITSLAVSGTTLYAGGYFTSAEGTPHNRLAAFDTTTDALLAWNPSASSVVQSIAVAGSRLYVGGGFSSITDSVTTYTRHYAAAVGLTDGLVDPTWDPSPGNIVSDIAATGTKVYLTGTFTTIGTGPAQVARRKFAAVNVTDGTADSWDLDLGEYQGYALGISAGKLLVGTLGSAYAPTSLTNVMKIRPDGTPDPAWDPPNFPHAPTAIAVSGDYVYVGGPFFNVGGAAQRGIAKLNRATGALEPWNPNLDGAVNALAVYGDAIVVGGSFTHVASASHYGIAIIDQDSAVATDFALETDGTVSALALDGSVLYIGGDFATVGGAFRNDVAQLGLAVAGGAVTGWDAQLTGDSVSAIAVTNDHVHLGGLFSAAGPDARANYAELDKTVGTATAFAPNPNGKVTAIAPFRGKVYVGGWFDTFAGASRGALAAFDEADGSLAPWDPSASYRVTSLAIRNYRVLVGGQMSNELAGHVAGWPYAYVTAVGVSPAAIDVTDVLPATGPTAGGIPLDIFGTGLEPGATVTLGGVDCPVITAMIDALLECLTPPHAAGLVDIVIDNADGGTLTIPDGFRYVADPPTTKPRLRVSTTLGSRSARVGATLAATVRVRNVGDGFAALLVVRIAIPRGTRVADANGGTVKGGYVTWRLRRLNAGKAATRTAVLRLTAPGPIAIVSSASAYGLAVRSAAAKRIVVLPRTPRPTPVTG